MGSSSAVYRNKLKERDPQKYAEYLRKQRELSRKSRMALKEALQTKCPNTDALEKKAHQLALARERQARYNAKKRTSGSKVRKKVVPALKSPTVKTDANSSNKSQREYWTMIKRKQRATMSDQQRALEKQKDRERKAAKRAKQMQHNDLHVPTVPPMGPIAFPVGSFSSHVPKAHR